MVKDKKETTPPTIQEREALLECIREAFWYRSLPLGLFTGSAALLAVRSGKFKLKSRFGGWPLVLGFGSLGYILGKVSYLTSEQCKDIFLRKAPDSTISEDIRLRREAAAAEDEALPGRFMDVIGDLDDEELTDKEHKILEDCNNIAFYRYSLPISLLSGWATYFAVKTKVLKESRILTSLPRLPKTVLGSSVGYIVGQYLYVKSADCPRRFQKFDPEGTVSRLLRREEAMYMEEFTHKPAVVDKSADDYVLPPRDSGVDIEATILDSWTNSFSNKQ